MKYKLFIISLFLTSCANNFANIDNKSPYSATGFAYIYSERDHAQRIIKNKLDNSKVEVSHNKLKVNSLVKIINPKTNDSIIVKNLRKNSYPDFYKVLITQEVANQINLDTELPLVEILEIKKNKSFVAEKAQIFNEEKKISSNAPVANVEISNISKNKKINNSPKKDKLFIIIATFYSYDTASFLKKRISKLNRSNNSFAIFGATINTHLDGIKDDRMDDLIGSKYGNDLEHSIKSLDYLIGNFIEFLEKENLIENTAIFISADHSLPINKSLNYINNKLKNTDRSLYLISNKDINSEDEILQVHLPKILLNSANIKHNHKFFYELNNYNDLDGFIEKNKNNFSKYNNSIIEFKKTPKNIKFEINKDNFEIIVDNIPGYNLTLLNNSPSYINLLFDKNFIFKNDNFKKESKKPRKIRKEDENYNYNILTIFKNNNKIITGKIIDANKKIIFPLPVKNGEIVLNIEEYNSNFKLNNFMKDRKRFIAHAGGSLSGYKYLNALEALDENYLNGFRFFELDLQLTSDNFIVAAHDWDMWKKMTGFKKKTPPSLRDFNELRIYNKFTGLDYEKINKWFNENNNAVLVVDKINNVEKFSEQIKINKDRIIIETFSKESTTQFKKKGYKIIANIDFLRKLSNPIEFLKKNNIENISVSQKIKKNVEYNFINFLESLYKINLEKRLLNNGFKLYAFNLNEEDDTITEKDIVCKYRYIFYGMYADNWDFNKSINSCDNNDN